VPQTASVGQTRTISVAVSNRRYPETVQVQLYKSVAGGSFQPVGSLTQSLPVLPSNRTTSFSIDYTFVAEDRTLGATPCRPTMRRLPLRRPSAVDLTVHA
jgi:hypothetical protein